jgi:hypothetical protein
MKAGVMPSRMTIKVLRMAECCPDYEGISAIRLLMPTNGRAGRESASNFFGLKTDSMTNFKNNKIKQWVHVFL